MRGVDKDGAVPSSKPQSLLFLKTEVFFVNGKLLVFKVASGWHQGEYEKG